MMKPAELPPMAWEGEVEMLQGLRCDGPRWEVGAGVGGEVLLLDGVVCARLFWVSVDNRGNSVYRGEIINLHEPDGPFIPMSTLFGSGEEAKKGMGYGLRRLAEGVLRRARHLALERKQADVRQQRQRREQRERKHRSWIHITRQRGGV